MGWQTLADATPPVGRPLRVRIAESDEPVIAFLAADGVWYSGSALVQSAGTLLSATPLAWCELDGEDAL
ncbi:hypothetical protein HZF05_09550 [Sphingomonas sp. CGMCC 1.13654]|uniref:Uncharacterized protein n=1 Tax=Sphingomonas chungangi TaxID=2683589 RepID=A0A838L6Q5_9SPHN|nr:hypothetical protein [Sphingomonas chungangi]MBA2934342.1 hypothetical protein [Sphingomonas chungangi]MVW57382.1 hypothetical protein [Sphingomonas chungangi]